MTIKPITFNDMTEADYMGFAGAPEKARIAYTDTSTDSVAIIAQQDGQLEVCMMNEDGDTAAFHISLPTLLIAETMAKGIDYETMNLEELGFERIA